MLTPLIDIDIDFFLSLETDEWCMTQLLFFGGDRGDEQTPFILFYLWLRQRVQEHQESQQEPRLSIIPTPTGGTKEYVSKGKNTPILYEY